ncbi:MAG: hypothetical protein J6J36_04490 [Clostridia bacterium]|nr:hypothetical protein [Clostridia bacterium]
MIKKEVLDLVDVKNADFKDIFSLCIGNMYIIQKRFIDYIGTYGRWNTSVKEGMLMLDDKKYDVEFIGTTSTADNYWFSSELEQVIPDEYVNIMIQTRKILQAVGIDSLAQGKILLDDEKTGYNLSMIYLAFAPVEAAYFNGSGDTSIYMFVKNLPQDIFKKMNSIEFVNSMMEIIGTFNVNHKLLIKAVLIQNGIEYVEEGNDILAKFNEKSVISVQFDGSERITKINGNLSL